MIAACTYRLTPKKVFQPKTTTTATRPPRTGKDSSKAVKFKNRARGGHGGGSGGGGAKRDGGNSRGRAGSKETYRPRQRSSSRDRYRGDHGDRGDRDDRSRSRSHSRQGKQGTKRKAEGGDKGKDKDKGDEPPKKRRPKRGGRGESIPSFPSPLSSPPTALSHIDTSVFEYVRSLGFDITLLEQISSLPLTGRTSSPLCFPAWSIVTASLWTLDMVSRGLYWHWKTGPPLQSYRAPPPRPGFLSDEAVEVLDGEVSDMLVKSAITKSTDLPDISGPQFIVGFFAVPKKQKNQWRPIVNLRPLNVYIDNPHFKMETIKTVRQFIVKDSFLISIDLADAYMSFVIRQSFRQFLGFSWKGIDYFCRCLCFGLNVAPRLFSKIFKKVLRFLRIQLLIAILAYLDDLLMQHHDPVTLQSQMQVVVVILHLLGFRVNWKKSDLVPSQQVTFLGFNIDTVKMTLALPTSKVANIRASAASILEAGSLSFQALQSLMGTLEAARPAVVVAPLHYRALQSRMVFLTKKEVSSSFTVYLDHTMMQDLVWWRDELPWFTSSPLRDPPTSLTIWSDAASSEGLGWGGHSSDGGVASGVWSDTELQFHINQLESMAATLTMDKLLPPHTSATHFVDNMTAMSYIRRMGGTRSSGCCAEAIKYWSIVLARNSWIVPAHIAGVDNVMADYFSRYRDEHYNYGLRPEVASSLFSRFFQPSLDLFASQEMHVCRSWVSHSRMEGSVHPNAFLLSPWPNHLYIFPPTPLLLPVVARLRSFNDCPNFLLVGPSCQGEQSSLEWYPLLSPLLSHDPLYLGQTVEICVDSNGRAPSNAVGDLALYVRLQ